jgi:2-methylisocitrate lyase-like PEP mutase family enzyme
MPGMQPALVFSKKQGLRRLERQVPGSPPVTADIEAGYGIRPEDVAETVRVAIQAGVVGINLEDNTHNPGDAALFDLQA